MWCFGCSVLRCIGLGFTVFGVEDARSWVTFWDSPRVFELGVRARILQRDRVLQACMSLIKGV